MLLSAPQLTMCTSEASPVDDIIPHIPITGVTGLQAKIVPIDTGTLIILSGFPQFCQYKFP